IGFPIYMGDEEKPVNKQTSLWRTSKQDVTEEQYKDFYKQTTLDFEGPLTHIHLLTDAPVQLYALLYIPAKGERNMFSLRKDDGLKLYTRNILIDEYNKDLLPEYLRFVQGVVDSEDLPLNVSRETVQSSGLMPKLKKVLTGQVMRELGNLAKNDAEKYETFWKEFGVYLKQGIAADPNEADTINPLLRFKTNLNPETWSSLEDYVSRMKDDQKDIFYIVGEDPKSVLLSPHLDYFHSQGTEVLLLTDPMDSFMIMGLRKHKDFDLKYVSQAEVDESKKPDEQPEEKRIPDSDFDSLVEQFKNVLGDRVADVRASNRLTQSVARLAEADANTNPDLQRVYKYLGQEYEIPKKVLELNPSHDILRGILELEADSELQIAIIEQIFDSALLVEGIHPDPSSIAPRVQQIIEAALQKESSS
ncbi:MAG: molecular chaperone HtpG, partial [Anaerolineales bacterium]|nr:molecular chaperone HtpG [Anaerolineales bacterium]